MTAGPARRAGILGSPVAHSRSPQLHLAAYRALGLDWAYEAYEVTEWELPAFIAELDDAWAGLSLTMPLKSAVIPLLDSVDEIAGAITSVNTVLPRDGGWHGTNTDIHGIVEALAPHLHRPPLRATVIGTGATARSVIAACALKALGGAIHGRLWPRNDEERREALDAGYDIDRILTTDDLVASDDVFFAATGISDGEIVHGVHHSSQGAKTQTVVMRSKTGTIRTINASHQFHKLRSISPLEY